MREFMILKRTGQGKTLAQMAKRCMASAGLLRMLEEDEDCVTHPRIAERIAKAYRLTPKQAEGMLPENYRPHSPHYDPDRYVEADPEYRNFEIRRGCI